MLPVQKQKALGKIKLKNAFNASLAGYALLMNGLQQLRMENVKLSDIQFPHQKKPFFKNGPDFNISHTEERAVCAISSDVKVGVDIEQVVPQENYQLKNYFNLEELLYIDESPSRFYEVWTKKEAVLKAVGNAGLTQAKQIKLYGPYAVFAQIKWHLYTYAWDDYCIAVAGSQEQEVVWNNKMYL